MGLAHRAPGTHSCVQGQGRTSFSAVKAGLGLGPWPLAGELPSLLGRYHPATPQELSYPVLLPIHSGGLGPQRATCPGRNDAATSHSLGPMQTALPTTIRKVQGRMAGHSQALQTLDKTCHLPNPALPPPALPTPAGMGRSPGGKLTWYILGSPVRNLK